MGGEGMKTLQGVLGLKRQQEADLRDERRLDIAQGRAGAAATAPNRIQAAAIQIINAKGQAVRKGAGGQIEVVDKKTGRPFPDSEERWAAAQNVAKRQLGGQ